MAERSKAAVLKTARAQALVGSNPTPSSIMFGDGGLESRYGITTTLLVRRHAPTVSCEKYKPATTFCPEPSRRSHVRDWMPPGTDPETTERTRAPATS